MWLLVKNNSIWKDYGIQPIFQAVEDHFSSLDSALLRITLKAPNNVIYTFPQVDCSTAKLFTL